MHHRRPARSFRLALVAGATLAVAAPAVAAAGTAEPAPPAAAAPTTTVSDSKGGAPATTVATDGATASTVATDASTAPAAAVTPLAEVDIAATGPGIDIGTALDGPTAVANLGLQDMPVAVGATVAEYSVRYTADLADAAAPTYSSTASTTSTAQSEMPAADILAAYQAAIETLGTYEATTATASSEGSPRISSSCASSRTPSTRRRRRRRALPPTRPPVVSSTSPTGTTPSSCRVRRRRPAWSPSR